MLPSWCNTTVTRVRPATLTQRGSTFRDWTQASESEVKGCNVQPDATSSDFSDREQSVLTYTIYAPVGADIIKGDRIKVDGHTFDVVGVPFKWYSPNGTTDHLFARMTEWEG